MAKKKIENPSASYDPSDIAVMEAKEFKKLVSTDISFLAETFGINRQSQCDHLDNWLHVSGILAPEDQHLLDRVFEKFKEDINYWNEEELKIQLISFLFLIADVDIKNQVKVFFERPLSGIVDGHNLSVVADCLVATPAKFSKPKKPYFFMQEYKKGRGDAKDPECQMLLAMMIAREANADNKPLYGSYLFGSHWRFTTLVGNDYCVSEEFNADQQEDLLHIVFILRKLKELILNR